MADVFWENRPRGFSRQNRQTIFFKMPAFVVIGFIFTFLWFARLTFTLLSFIPACVCLSNDTTTETCGNHVLGQDLKDEINMAGTLTEAGNSFLIIVLVFCWGNFNVTNFFLAAPRLAAFWFWIGLFSLHTISWINRDVLPSPRIFLGTSNGVSIFFESATIILLSLALKFINKSTVRAWINRKVASEHWSRYLYYLYIFTLWMYLLRNLALLFYDMATFAKKIDRHANSKQIDHVLCIVDIAFRGSFVQFYYATIFRNPNLSTVCKENTRPDIFPVAMECPSDRPQTIMPWEPYIK